MPCTLLWTPLVDSMLGGTGSPQPELDASVKIEFKSVRKLIEFVRKVWALKAEQDSCNQAI
jgi:hypothetical protein